LIIGAIRRIFAHEYAPRSQGGVYIDIFHTGCIVSLS